MNQLLPWLSLTRLLVAAEQLFVWVIVGAVPSLVVGVKDAEPKAWAKGYKEGT